MLYQKGVTLFRKISLVTPCRHINSSVLLPSASKLQGFWCTATQKCEPYSGILDLL